MYGSHNAGEVFAREREGEKPLSRPKPCSHTTYAVEALLPNRPGSICGGWTSDQPRCEPHPQEIEMRKTIVAIATILTVVATTSAFAAGGGAGGGGTDNPMPTAQSHVSDD